METKKNKNADLGRWKSTFFNMSLSVSLGVVILAFNYSRPALDLKGLNGYGEEEILTMIPPTDIPPPPPPKPPVVEPIVVETPEEEMPEDPPPMTFTSDDPFQEIDLNAIEGPGEEDPVEAPWEGVLEDNAEFKGGIEAMMRYLSENIDYPTRERRMGVSGRVFVQFVVEKDGSLTQVRVVRGVSEGLDAEALRAVKGMPAWEPGRQRGRAVRQRIVIPVLFRLQ